MFPEYRELISTLKIQDAHFQRKFNEHNQLDEEITQLEKRLGSDFTPEVKELKTKKLHLKEEIYQILKSHK
ncbi:MAG: YdcH family protein [Shewanella sp.]